MFIDTVFDDDKYIHYVKPTKNVKIYLAAPLFTDAEIYFNSELANILDRNGYNVFLPQSLDIDYSKNGWQVEVFNLNVQHIDESDILVAVLDGSSCDDGTSWEVGYAYAKGKIVVGYRTDFRESYYPEGKVNLMLGCSAVVVQDLDRLLKYLEKISEERK